MQNGEIASVWMPQWYMTRFPDNMADLCGSMIVRPMPLFEEGGFTTTMGGGTGTAVTDQTARRGAGARQGVPGLRQAHQGSPEGALDRPRLRSLPHRRLRRPRLLATDDCFSGEVPFEYHQERARQRGAGVHRPALPGGPDDYLQEVIAERHRERRRARGGCAGGGPDPDGSAGLTSVHGPVAACRSGPMREGDGSSGALPSHAGMLRT